MWPPFKMGLRFLGETGSGEGSSFMKEPSGRLLLVS